MRELTYGLAAVVCVLIGAATTLIVMDVPLAPFYELLEHLQGVFVALGGFGGLVAVYRVMRDKPINANAEVASVATLDTAEETRRQVERLTQGLSAAGIVLPDAVVLPAAPPAMTVPPPPPAPDLVQAVQDPQGPLPWDPPAEVAAKARGRRRG